MTDIPGLKNTSISLKEGLKFTEESLSPEEVEKGNTLAINICNTIQKCSKYELK